MNALHHFYPVGLALLAAVGMMLAAFGTGEAILYRRKESSPVISVALGMLVWALIVWVAPGNVTWQSSPESGWTLHFIRFLPYLMSPAVLWGVWRLKRIPREQYAGFLFVSPLMLFFLGSALLPPLTWDEQVYQAVLPLRYWYDSSVAVRVDNPYSAYPSLQHLFLAPGIGAGGLGILRLAGWFVTWLVGGSLWNALRKNSSVLTASVLTAAVMLSPLALVETSAFYAEIFIVLFAFAAFLEAQAQERFSLLLAGILAGGAVAVKYTGGAVPVALIVWFCRQKEYRKAARSAAGAAVALLPFVLRIWCGTGNPVYPFCASLFGTSKGVEHFYTLLGSRYGLDPVMGTLGGWALVSFAGEFYDNVVTGFQFPLMLAIALGGAWLARRNGEKNPRRSAALAAWFAAYLFWGVTAQQSRFLYPLLFALPVLVLPCMKRKIVSVVLVAATLVSLGLSYKWLNHYVNAWKYGAAIRKDPFPAAAGRDRDFADALTFFSGKWHGIRVALAIERRTLYLPCRATVLMPGFQERLTPVPDDAESVMAVLKDYDYLLISISSGDVDAHSATEAENVKLYDHFKTLMEQGKLQNVPGHPAILRVAPGGGGKGVARSKSESSSAREDKSDASARNSDGK